MGLITDATDTELEQTRQAIVKEQERRRTLANAGQAMDDIAKSVLAASGIEPGDEWVQPTGAMDAYPQGWEVVHGGASWVSLTPANVFEPGVSSWREIVPEGEAPPEWVQPSGATDAYSVGDQVTYNGEVFESIIDANVWSPDAHAAGWKLVA